MTSRNAFLGASHTARTLIADRDVARRWAEPSALAEMTIGDLAGHLARGVFTVDQYLREPAPDGSAAVSQSEYFVRSPLTSDVGDELNTQIRARARNEAADGHAALVSRLDDAIGRMTDALSHEPATRTVAVFANTPMLLDDYLVARVVELVVHLDDLAVSIDRDTPTVPAEAADVALRCMLDMARLRHGDVAVLRALARRERAATAVFPVF